MRVHFAIITLRWVTLITTILFALGRIIYILNARSKNSKLPRRLLRWFSQLEVDGTTSDVKRKYMKNCNYLSIGTVVSLGIFLFLYMLPE